MDSNYSMYCDNCGNEICNSMYRKCSKCDNVWCDDCIRSNAFYCKCDNIDDTPENQELAYKMNKEYGDKMEEYEKIYNEFWKPIIEKEDDIFDIDQIKKELADYYIILENFRKVYLEITGQRFGNVLTDPIHILDEFEKATKQDIQDSIEDLIDSYEDDGWVSVNDIRSYFE
jgi:hypothetical protein